MSLRVKDAAEGRENRDLVCELRQFGSRDRLESRIAQRRQRGCVAHREVERLHCRGVADAPAQRSRLGDGDKSSAFLVERTSETASRTIRFILSPPRAPPTCGPERAGRSSPARLSENGVLLRRSVRGFHKQIRAVSNHARTVAGNIARIGVLEHARPGSLPCARRQSSRPRWARLRRPPRLATRSCATC